MILYDLIYSDADSALKYYELLQSYHPESEQAVVSKKRLMAINNLFDDSSEEEDLLDDIEPDNYFVENKMITLDEVKTYEIKLKNKLEVLYQNYPDRVKNIVSSLKNDISITDNSLETLVPLLDECKVKDMLPLIYFHTNVRL